MHADYVVFHNKRERMTMAFFGSKEARLTRQRCDDYFANPDNFVPAADRPAIDPTDLIGETHEEVELSEQDWSEENVRIAAHGEAQERKRLENEASNCPIAAHRLAAIIESENWQRALATCAEDERRRPAAAAEAEASALNLLFLE